MQRLGVALGFVLAATAARAQPFSADKVRGLPAFFDATLPPLLAAGHVPGASVVVIHDGRVVLLRGYGRARLEGDGVNVDPSETLFRVGSVSKVMTAIAVVQLAAEGRVDLQRDIRQYLPGMPLPSAMTTHQLLTHTAGLLERFTGQYTVDANYLQPLADHVRHFMPEQVTPPGRAYSYSNYGIALAGLVIERVSGMSYADYMQQHVFAPLGMTSTIARQPVEPPLSARLARGYRWNRGSYEALPYAYTQTPPAGAVSTTAADMGRLIAAVLDGGRLDGRQVLPEQAVAQLLAAQYSPDPRIPAHAYGLTHWTSHGRHLLHKDGTLSDHVGVMVLDPADRFGMFVGSNGPANAEGTSIGNLILEPLLTYLAGPAAPAPPATPMAGAGNASRVAGIYLSLEHTSHEMADIRALMPAMQQRVAALPDGAITFAGRRWLEIEPLVFRAADTDDYIVFRQDADDAFDLHTWSETYRRIPWWRRSLIQVGLLVTCVLAFVVCAVALGWARAQARAAAGLVLALNLGFLALAPRFFPGLGASVPLPALTTGWLMLPVLGAAATVMLVLFTAIAWRRKAWTLHERITCSVLSLVSSMFLCFLYYWSLLGVRY